MAHAKEGKLFGEDTLHTIIFALTGIILIPLDIYAIVIDVHWKLDIFLLILALVFVYLLRKKLHLHPLHYLFLSVFLLLHAAVTFHLYERHFFGMEYDFYIHLYFGFASSIILYRLYLCRSLPPHYAFLFVITLTLGLSAFHEIVEYTGAVTLGKGEGLLFIGAGDIDEWDTQKDMLNNVIGAMIGSILYWSWRKIQKGALPHPRS